MEGVVVVVVKLLLFMLFISMLTLSNAVRFELYVANQFSNEGGIKLEVVDGRNRYIKELSQGGELHWNITMSLHPYTRVACGVDICAGGVYVRLDSFFCFSSEWVAHEISNINKGKKLILKWVVNEENALLLHSSVGNYQRKHKWSAVVLIFITANKFSGKQDMVVSIHKENKKAVEIVAGQVKIPGGKKIIAGAALVEAYHEESAFRCFVDKGSTFSRKYVGFFDFSIPLLSDSGSVVGVINIELTMEETGATVLLSPSNSIQLQYSHK